MLIVINTKKDSGFWIRFNYSRILNHSELPIPDYCVELTQRNNRCSYSYEIEGKAKKGPL